MTKLCFKSDIKRNVCWIIKPTRQRIFVKRKKKNKNLLETLRLEIEQVYRSIDTC